MRLKKIDIRIETQLRKEESWNWLSRYMVLLTCPLSPDIPRSVVCGVECLEKYYVDRYEVCCSS